MLRWGSMCAGKWIDAWHCTAALQGIRPLRLVLNALTLTLDDLASSIDGALDGLTKAKNEQEMQTNALLAPQPQPQPQRPLSAQA